MVLDSFIKRSVTGGLGSAQAEIMAETAVSLSAANVALVARKVIWRLCRVIDKTCISPTTRYVYTSHALAQMYVTFSHLVHF